MFCFKRRQLKGSNLGVCQNGGICQSCQCRGGWTGEHCQNSPGPTPCQRAALDTAAGHHRLECTEDGDYKPLQCGNGFCFCVDSRGQKITGSERAEKDAKPNCDGGVDPAPGKVSVYPETFFNGTPQILPGPGVYTGCRSQLNFVTGVQSLRVPEGFKVTLYDNCTLAGPTGEGISYLKDAVKSRSGKQAIVVERIGFKPVQNGLMGQEYACEKTSCPGRCCVPAAQAHELCRQDPTCKYVETTSDPAWNSAHPNSAALRTGVRRPNADWMSEEKTFDAPKMGQSGQGISCRESMIADAPMCVVPAEQAHAICERLPTCKYVETPTDPSKAGQRALTGGDLKPSKDWNAEPKSSPDTGKALPVAVFTGPNFTGKMQELKEPGVYTDCNKHLQVGRNTVSSVRVPPGFIVALYPDCTPTGPSGKPVVLNKDAFNLPSEISNKVAAVAVTREGWNMPADGKAGQDFVCKETTCTGKCCVPLDKAHQLCRENPLCKYVETTNDPKWNGENPNSAALRTGVQRPAPGWKSEEKNFEPELTGLKGQDYPCDASTCKGTGCCVPAGLAHELCVKDPKCLYVESSNNPAWNKQNPDTKVLRTGDRVRDADWNSEKKVPSVIREGAGAGSYPPVTVFKESNLTGPKQELPLPGVYRKNNGTLPLILNPVLNKDSSIYLPPGFSALVFTKEDKKVISTRKEDMFAVKNTALKLPQLNDRTAVAIGVIRDNYEFPINGITAENYACPSSTCRGDVCCVPSNVAQAICDADPKCKYLAKVIGEKPFENNANLRADLNANPFVTILQTGNPKSALGWSVEPKKDSAFPATCIIGSSPTSPTKSVDVPIAGTKVPQTQCGLGCRKNTDNLTDDAVFELKVSEDGKKINVKRVDKNVGWTHELRIPCFVGDDSLGSAEALPGATD